MSEGVLGQVREDNQSRWGVRLAGLAGGILLAQFSWVGFLVAGAAVGVMARDTKWAIAGGLITGVLCWLLFLATLAAAGTAELYLGMGQITGLSAAIPVVYAVFGSLLRGVL